ncbi:MULTISPECIES: hypothetical protein [Actinosynnema]|uniref:hypothetical protein n=1 Tax=Actinosynnema TaxID=40566 RepID=UPI0020A418F0|nr:hypothetical protein [Actinosynnema pretiosum]MCP2094699.1 hypothetical protein [Actinosynnema pretiosum]
MSFSTPFRRDDGRQRKRQDETAVVAQARQSAEQLAAHHEDDGAVVARPQRQQEQTSAAVPPVLELLLYHEEGRAAARARGDVQLASSALVEVVRDLDVLLDSAEDYVRRTGRGRSRRRVREAMPHLVAVSAITALPWAEVGEFLDLPPERVEGVLASLARHGSIDPPQRQRALEQITWLREQLRQVVVTKDHSLLDRLLALLSRFVLLGVVALASAASGAFAVGESVLKEVVKTGVVALVAAALQVGADHVRARGTERGRRDTAREAHTALLAELPAASGLWEVPAYEGEHTVIRTRLAVRMCAVRVASIPLDWQDKWPYWDLLDDLTAALSESTPDRFRVQLRRLTALTPPV